MLNFVAICMGFNTTPCTSESEQKQNTAGSGLFTSFLIFKIILKSFVIFNSLINRFPVRQVLTLLFSTNMRFLTFFHT